MSENATDRSAHWQHVYQTRDSGRVSWFRPHLDVSLDLLLGTAGLGPQASVIDVGGGASTLVDDLLDRGFRNLTVLDIAPAAIELSRRRLGARAAAVNWIAGDVLTTPLIAGAYDAWHDRAVLHFLTDDDDAERYARLAAEAVRRGGYAVIGGFAPDGPERCSGLPVARRSPEAVATLFGSGFEPVARRFENHVTPGGGEQAFAYALLRRH